MNITEFAQRFRRELGKYKKTTHDAVQRVGLNTLVYILFAMLSAERSPEYRKKLNAGEEKLRNAKALLQELEQDLQFPSEVRSFAEDLVGNNDWAGAFEDLKWHKRKRGFRVHPDEYLLNITAYFWIQTRSIPYSAVTDILEAAETAFSGQHSDIDVKTISRRILRARKRYYQLQDAEELTPWGYMQPGDSH